VAEAQGQFGNPRKREGLPLRRTDEETAYREDQLCASVKCRVWEIAIVL
jgi:hypothetical protein